MDQVRKRLKGKESGGEEEWHKLFKDPHQYDAFDFPKVTVVIPTYQCAHTVTRTLKSILDQKYPSLEVIVIDAGSTDRTIPIIRGYDPSQVRLCSVYRYHLYEMLNKGIMLSRGQYLNFLYPGDYYIHDHVLKEMMSLAIEHDNPEIVFGASLLREQTGGIRVLFRPFDIKSLKKGHQPTSLESCWFRKDCLQDLEGFKEKYSLRGGFDLLCRFLLTGKYQVASTSKVVTDYEERVVTRPMILVHFWESFQVIFRYFGLWSLLSWIFRQRDFYRLVRSWSRSIKVALFGGVH